MAIRSRVRTRQAVSAYRDATAHVAKRCDEHLLLPELRQPAKREPLDLEAGRNLLQGQQPTATNDGCAHSKPPAQTTPQQLPRTQLDSTVKRLMAVSRQMTRGRDDQPFE